MSSKRIDLPDAPLCRFSFADGRRCTQPAHPAHDGFCFHHATHRRSASRKENLLRLCEPLIRKGVSQIDLQTAFSGLSREVAAGRIGRKSASTLAYLGPVLFQSDQMITEDEFRALAGPRWSHICALLDDDSDDRDRAYDDNRTIDVSPTAKTPRDPSH